jgi:hypothetical protein
MAWLTRWRLVRLLGVALVILALAGPMGYDLLSVPPAFECQPPTIRLNEDFCGWPVTGYFSITELVNIVSTTVTQTYPANTGAIDIIGGLLLWFAFTLVIIAPIISLVVRLKNRQTRWAGLHIAILIPVTALAGYSLFHARTHQPLQIWGLWLYVISVFFILVEQAVVEINHYQHRVAI